MPLAITLRLDAASAAVVIGWWRALAEAGLDDDCLTLGYAPHVTLAVCDDETDAAALGASMRRVGREWQALAIGLSGFGVFPGEQAGLYAAPVVTAALLDMQAALHAALPPGACHAHYRPGHWVAHVTLARAMAEPARAMTALMPLWQPVEAVLERLELVRFRPVQVLDQYRLRLNQLRDKIGL